MSINNGDVLRVKDVHFRRAKPGNNNSSNGFNNTSSNNTNNNSSRSRTRRVDSVSSQEHDETAAADVNSTATAVAASQLQQQQQQQPRQQQPQTQQPQPQARRQQQNNSGFSSKSSVGEEASSFSTATFSEQQQQRNTNSTKSAATAGRQHNFQSQISPSDGILFPPTQTTSIRAHKDVEQAILQQSAAAAGVAGPIPVSGEAGIPAQHQQPRRHNNNNNSSKNPQQHQQQHATTMSDVESSSAAAHNNNNNEHSQSATPLVATTAVPTATGATSAADEPLDVACWLKSIGMEMYVQAFASQHIDDQSLPDLTNEDLWACFGIKSWGHRKRLCKAIEALRESRACANPPIAVPIGTSVVHAHAEEIRVHFDAQIETLNKSLAEEVSKREQLEEVVHRLESDLISLRKELARVSTTASTASTSASNAIAAANSAAAALAALSNNNNNNGSSQNGSNITSSPPLSSTAAPNNQANGANGRGRGKRNNNNNNNNINNNSSSNGVSNGATLDEISQQKQMNGLVLTPQQQQQSILPQQPQQQHGVAPAPPAMHALRHPTQGMIPTPAMYPSTYPYMPRVFFDGSMQGYNGQNMQYTMGHQQMGMMPGFDSNGGGYDMPSRYFVPSGNDDMYVSHDGNGFGAAGYDYDNNLLQQQQQPQQPLATPLFAHQLPETA